MFYWRYGDDNARSVYQCIVVDLQVNNKKCMSDFNFKIAYFLNTRWWWWCKIERSALPKIVVNLEVNAAVNCVADFNFPYLMWKWHMMMIKTVGLVFLLFFYDSIEFMIDRNNMSVTLIV